VLVAGRAHPPFSGMRIAADLRSRLPDWKAAAILP